LSEQPLARSSTPATARQQRSMLTAPLMPLAHSALHRIRGPDGCQGERAGRCRAGGAALRAAAALRRRALLVSAGAGRASQRAAAAAPGHAAPG